VRKLLFVCSQNRLRSPTAERLFARYPDVAVASAGLDADAARPVTPELVAWADWIFVMEKTHRNKLRRRFAGHCDWRRVICLNIPDHYDFMDPQLIALLEARVGKYLDTP
jgi:predicted protein tyrosine phosphatase